MSVELRIDQLVLEGRPEELAERLERALAGRLDPERSAAVAAAVAAEIQRRTA